MRQWDVSNQSRWSSLIDKKITGADSYWYEFTEDRKSFLLPQELKLVFEFGAPVCISLCMIENDIYHTAVDQITVFFDDQVARAIGIGSFGNPARVDAAS